MNSDLDRLGFENWFQQKVDPKKLEEYKIARVITVNKDNYLIKNDKTEALAEITGKLIYSAESPLDFPAVGDWVYLQFFDGDSFAIIHEILPRRSIIKRKTPGKKIAFQPIAANINTAYIMQSLDENYNISRLERYLVMVKNSNIQPVVLLSKSDLISNEEVEAKVGEIRATNPDLMVIPFSNFQGEGVAEIKSKMSSGQTYCLLGSSGVGKTALLNNLLGEELFKTAEVRAKDSRGRHTTSRRQLIILENGAMLIDTPGMRELGNFDIETGLEETFDEITLLASNCRFKDCSHTREKDCAILLALDEGRISEERYRNFLKITKEAAYYERSYLEKRKKDKEFGKMVKSIKKNFIKK